MSYASSQSFTSTPRTWGALIAVSTATLALREVHAVALASPPCPPFEVECSETLPSRNDPVVEPVCDCGTGYWHTVVLREELRPRTPISSSVLVSAGQAAFRVTRDLEATPGEARANLSVLGDSAWWDAGSHATTVFASYYIQREECWLGDGPPCPRLIQPVASGSASLVIAATAAARQGCTASATTTAMGSAFSRGDASARIPALSISGRAGYASASDSVVIEGNFGPMVTVEGATYSGSFSSEDSYEVEGTGSDTGSAGVVVSPDREYCAWTNKAVRYTMEGRAAAVCSSSVDENGSSAAAAEATISLTVN